MNGKIKVCLWNVTVFLQNFGSLIKTFAFVNKYYNFDSVVIQSIGTINYPINWNNKYKSAVKCNWFINYWLIENDELVIRLTVCCYHVTYAYHLESKLNSCLNVKKLLARKRRDIWNLSDRNGIWTHNHLLCKRTLNHLAKLARLQTKWLLVWIPLLLLDSLQYGKPPANFSNFLNKVRDSICYL